MQIPDGVFERLDAETARRNGYLDIAKQTPDGMLAVRPYIRAAEAAIQLALGDAIKFLLMKDRGDYVEILPVRNPEHMFELRQEMERQLADWRGRQFIPAQPIA
jgi:hypothetical protein